MRRFEGRLVLAAPHSVAQPLISGEGKRLGSTCVVALADLNAPDRAMNSLHSRCLGMRAALLAAYA